MLSKHKLKKYFRSFLKHATRLVEFISLVDLARQLNKMVQANDCCLAKPAVHSVLETRRSTSMEAHNCPLAPSQRGLIYLSVHGATFPQEVTRFY